jgi:Tfp pilus assembly protein PilF
VNPSNVQAWNNLANARKDQGDLEEAERHYLTAVRLDPRFIQASIHLGLLQMQRHRFDEAVTCFRRALEVDPTSAEAWNNLGAVLRIQQKLIDAEESFRKALHLNPALPEAWSSLGELLQLRRRIDEAEICCRHALDLRPSYADALNNLATIAKARGELDTAQDHANEALRSAPGHIGVLNNLGSIAARRNDYRSAESMYRRALDQDPEHPTTRYNLATTLLMRGQYTEGFELYESRFDAFPDLHRVRDSFYKILRAMPRWLGEPLNGARLFVWAEQGLGDALMMLRYLPALRSKDVGTVIVLCDPALARLVRLVDEDITIYTSEEEAEGAAFDVHCPIMSLPQAFGTRFDAIPAEPYLCVPEGQAATWSERLKASKFRVGITWAGNNDLQEDPRRSIPLKCFAPLFSIPDIEFVSLQKGLVAIEWTAWRGEGGEQIEQCHDFLDTAALVANLDLVISVDTAVAHLAGALGRPVWLLNRFASEWRWGDVGERSPWYPRTRIYREPAPYTWDAVIARVAADLSRITGSSCRYTSSSQLEC